MQKPSNNRPDPLIGRRIAGRYELVECIGLGGMGAVYRALQWPLRRSVAVKILSPKLTTHSRSVWRFVNEARILSMLRHPNTVQLIDFGRTKDGGLFMVMEYVSGGTLRDLMRGRRIAVAPALRLAEQIARALAEAHANGVIHRDLKPENVLLQKLRSEELLVRLIDFGLAKEEVQISDLAPCDDLAQREVTRPRTRLGTVGYMSPEQAFRRPVDPTADLYALGVILYEMLTGYRLFESDTRDGLCLEHLYSTPAPFAEMAPDLDIDRRVEALVMELLAKRAVDRPKSAAEVAQRIQDLLRDLVAPTRLSTPTPPRPRRPEPQTMELLPRSRLAHRPLLAAVFLGGLVVAVATLLAL